MQALNHVGAASAKWVNDGVYFGFMMINNVTATLRCAFQTRF